MTAIIQEFPTIDSRELEQSVKALYRNVAQHPEARYHFEMGRALAERLGYPSHVLDQIPSRSIDSFAGVGYFFDLINLQDGECVVDLGSGSGMDAFFAATKIGTTGEIYGLDMTEAQLEKSQGLKADHGFNQVHFLKSYIESPCIVTESIDAVISNGVINLSSQKSTVFKEVTRILRPGGRLAIADIVSTRPLPKHISGNSALWAACIGGAIEEQAYLDLIASAGLRVEVVRENPYEFLSKGAQGATNKYGIKSISILASKPG